MPRLDIDTPIVWNRPPGRRLTGPPPVEAPGLWDDQPERIYPCSVCDEPVGETPFTTRSKRRVPAGKLCSAECCLAHLTGQRRKDTKPTDGVGLTLHEAVKRLQARGYSYATQAKWWRVSERTVEKWGRGA